MYKARINNNTDTKIVNFSNIDDTYIEWQRKYGELWVTMENGHLLYMEMLTLNLMYLFVIILNRYIKLDRKSVV